MTRGLRAMVLAAGLGSRLRPLTNDLPKPLVPFLDTTLLGRTLGLLGDLGLESAVVNASYRGDAVAEYVGRGSPGWPAEVRVSREPRPLGTGGAIRWAETALGDEAPVLVVNGDILVGLPDLVGLLDAHRLGNATATLLLTDQPELDPRLRKVAVDADRRIVEVDGRPERAAPSIARFGYCGILVAEPAFFRALPPRGEFACLKEHGFWPALDSRTSELRAVLAREPWADIGTPASYAQAQFEMIRGSGGLVSADAQVAADATIGNRVVISSGATVASGADLDRVIVWPGGRAEGKLRDAIVWSGGTHQFS